MSGGCTVPRLTTQVPSKGLAANAGPESAALKTCTAAFASSLTAKGAESPSVKLNYRSSQPGSAFAEYYTRDYTFFLKANDPKTGAARNPEEREEAESRAKAIVIAAAHYNDPKVLAEVSEQMTGAMQGLAVAGLEEGELLQTRGW